MILIVFILEFDACNAEDPGSVSGLGRSPGEGNGIPLQYSFLENSMDRGAWGATGHKVTKSLDTTEWLMLSPSLFEFNQKLNATECLQQPIGEPDIYEKVTDLIVWC